MRAQKQLTENRYRTVLNTAPTTLSKPQHIYQYKISIGLQHKSSLLDTMGLFIYIVYIPKTFWYLPHNNMLSDILKLIRGLVRFCDSVPTNSKHVMDTFGANNGRKDGS